MSLLSSSTETIQFELPAGRWATLPPERRGIPRDRVRLLAAGPDGIRHTTFAAIGELLSPGDAVVVNVSATRPAAIDGLHATGPVVIHLATHPGDHTWVVEVRQPDNSGPLLAARPGDLVALEGGGHLTLRMPAAAGPGGTGVRLWHAEIRVPGNLAKHMRLYGRPITYGNTDTAEASGPLPLSDYQTVFARTPGSAEMPSAGRPFSTRLITQLVSAGVTVLPVTLHAGVSSQEAGEPPQPEWSEVPEATAAAVNQTRRSGGRIIAVGTTVTRALESAVTAGGVRGRRGWTDLVITPERGVQVVDGLITGWHEPDASHLLLLQAVAGHALVDRAYREAVAGPYLWHEFGDSCLLLP